MHVERLLQINIAALIGISTFLVGWSRHNVALPLGMLFAAMLSVWVTDVLGRIRIPPAWAKVAMIGAMAITIPGVMRPDKLSVITGIGGFLVYLQLIHLFQKKDRQIYWVLVVLSVIQVVVAALLNQDMWFGVVLILYLFTALSGMFLLFLHLERPATDADALEPLLPKGSRWPLGRQSAVFQSPQPGRLPVEREMFWRLFKMGMFVLAVSVMVFFTVPRFGHGAWRGAGFGGGSRTGFSDRVTLGQLGSLIDDPEQVLKIEFRLGGDSYKVHDDVYLRGAVLNEYRRGEWRAKPRPTDRNSLLSWHTPPPPATTVVEQRIHFESMQGDGLFCVWPVVLGPGWPDERIVYDPVLERLSRQQGRPQDSPHFVLGTTGFRQGNQRILVPSDLPPDMESLLEWPEELLPGLKAQGDQWLEMTAATTDNLSKARYLERMFHSSPRFSYSLEGRPWTDGVDPVEDFIVNHPIGHCEYFASALVLMLRSQGIPARMVVGYKTDEWNSMGKFFQVRQLHAHAWVEAWLPPGEIPEDLRGAEDWSHGGWLRLDGTPAARDEAAGTFWTRGPGRYLDFLDFAWTNYIMQMDSPRQQETIYRPLADVLRTIRETVLNPQWWKNALAALRDALANLRDPEKSFFNWRAFLAITLFGGTFAVAFVVGPLLWRRWWGARRWNGGRARRGAGASVEFYRRLEAMLARAGLIRSPASTQLQFAEEAGVQLAEKLSDRELAALPVLVAEAFYQVRFGGAALDKSQSQTVEQALSRLDNALRKA